MAAIQADAVWFSYSDAVEVIAGASFRLETGLTGLVGDNGAGKSTLLGLVSGRLVPRAGRVRRLPPEAQVVLCPQEVASCSPEVRALAASTEAAGCRLRGRLHLEPTDLDRWSRLSPGERRRWQIAAALAAEPEVLLLDEPTNHLDAGSRALLVDALAGFRGVGLVVSHDRALLDGLTRTTLRLAGGRVEVHRGGYSDARAAWTAAREGRREAAAAQKAERRRLARRLDQARRDEAAASRSRSGARRMKGQRDHDARSSAAKGRAARGQQVQGRRVAVARRALERTGDLPGGAELAEGRLGAVFVDYVPAPTRQVLGLVGDVTTPDGRPVLEDLRLQVLRESRIHVAGDNGAGKSLLLRALVRGAREDRMLHLPQVLDAATRADLVRRVRVLPPAERGRVLSVVAALGSDPARLLATDAPSPGEARKLAMAFGLGRQAAVLVLDEPTNHLDLPSIERLEAALASYPGALVLTTHDVALAQATTTEVWEVAGGTVRTRGR